MRRRVVRQGRWSTPSWDALAVMPADQVPAGSLRREVVRDAGEEQHYLFRGLSLSLFKDGAESYWYNLVGDNPSLFVLCHEDPDGSPEPFSVTANADEASAGIEGDDGVYATPIAPAIYSVVERFVLEHFQPREKKMRKRKNWSDDQAI